MKTILDTIKTRLADAQNRLLQSKQRVAEAQEEYQSANLAVTTWQNALEFETRQEDRHASNSQATLDADLGFAATAVVVRHRPESRSVTTEMNRTDLVRELIRRTPNGIRPADLWHEVSGAIAHRPYLYSILKRLKDRNDIYERRGKYYARATSAPEEEKDQPSLQ
jgi:hypothetical protein